MSIANGESVYIRHHGFDMWCLKTGDYDNGDIKVWHDLFVGKVSKGDYSDKWFPIKKED